jgi:hypothetical protein
MRTFARVVFAVAGTWGVVVLTPLFFLFDVSGRAYPPPTSYPHFFYGFLAVALAWQCAFFVIASDPARYRVMMIPALIEKLGYVVGTSVLYLKSRISAADATTAVPDLALCVLFAIAFATTASSDAPAARVQ